MRSLILEDARDLAEIRKTSFEDFWSEEEFVSMLADESFFGFREDHGFILCRRAPDCIDIVTFCVIPSHRNRGVGKKLLSAVLNLANEAQCKVFLEVAEKNHIAIKLYEELGFERISMRKNYYRFSDGVQDAVVMECKSTKHLEEKL